MTFTGSDYQTSLEASAGLVLGRRLPLTECRIPLPLTLELKYVSLIDLYKQISYDDTSAD